MRKETLRYGRMKITLEKGPMRWDKVFFSKEILFKNSIVIKKETLKSLRKIIRNCRQLESIKNEKNCMNRLKVHLKERCNNNKNSLRKCCKQMFKKRFLIYKMVIIFMTFNQLRHTYTSRRRSIIKLGH